LLTQSFTDAVAEAEKIITGARAAMEALRAHSAPAAVGPAHRYALSDFGLTGDQVDERFAGYLR